ncbi:HEPN domain-containing protein [Pseudomonas sp. zbq_11]|uniref:HEPN domain-containing protein n=1 Tax=Pseudomonas TaxID=286 RepID=UPI00370C9771
MMDVSFRVLWFEDNPKYVKEIEENVQVRLDSFGIKFDVTMITDFSAPVIDRICKDIKKSCPYDLIMVDYDLGSREIQGDELLKKLRRSSFSSMIFYSAKTIKQLRELLLAKSVDGVFCLARDARLAGNIYAIVEGALNRVVQPNYMRGLVVSSVSYMDKLFNDLITLTIEQNLKPRDQILADLTKNFVAFQAEELAKMQQLSDKTLLKYISKSNFHVKTELLKELLALEGSQYSDSFLEMVEVFIKEVGNKRNKFAHTPTELVDGVPRLRVDNKLLDHNDMKQLLVIIRKHILAAEQAIKYYSPEPEIIHP